MYGENTVKPRKKDESRLARIQIIRLIHDKISKENLNNSSLLHLLTYGKCCLKRERT